MAIEVSLEEEFKPKETLFLEFICSSEEEAFWYAFLIEQYFHKYKFNFSPFRGFNKQNQLDVKYFLDLNSRKKHLFFNVGIYPERRNTIYINALIAFETRILLPDLLFLFALNKELKVNYIYEGYINNYERITNEKYLKQKLSEIIFDDKINNEEAITELYFHYFSYYRENYPKFFDFIGKPQPYNEYLKITMTDNRCLYYKMEYPIVRLFNLHQSENDSPVFFKYKNNVKPFCHFCIKRIEKATLNCNSCKKMLLFHKPKDLMFEPILK